MSRVDLCGLHFEMLIGFFFKPLTWNIQEMRDKSRTNGLLYRYQKLHDSTKGY